MMDRIKWQGNLEKETETILVDLATTGLRTLVMA